jgi:hypothetical protein
MVAVLLALQIISPTVNWLFLYPYNGDLRSRQRAYNTVDAHIDRIES